MKQAIEHVFADQLTIELFVDVYMLTKAFDLRYLQERILAFGVANRAELLKRHLLEKLDKDDILAINKAARRS